MPRKSRSLRNLTISPRRTSSPGPPSPTFSDATHASAMNFGADGPEKIITRADLKGSLQSYDEFMNATANYRAALLHMSKVTFAFADALEKCSGLKGPSYEAGTRLQAASGLHHLIGNHWHVLAETLDRSFEKPLRQHLDTYRTIVNERSASYEKALREKSEIIRQTEMSNMNKKQRNLQSFREALAVLQRQVDDLDDIKAQHYQEIMEHEEEVWDVVQGKVCVVVRSTMDVFDRFTSKASDPILEAMLQSVPDPFDSYGPPQAEDQIFTILPPLAVMANAPSPSPSPLATTPPQSSDVSPAIINNSWAPNGGFFANTTSEWANSVSPSSTPPRSASPPSMLKRRQSHPPTSIHHARKAESKLRSVLSVIDETHVRHPSDPVDTSPSEARTSQPDINGDPPEPDTSWETFTYGESPYPSLTDDVTPVQLTLTDSTPREVIHTDIGESDVSEIPQSPQSVETLHFARV
ncbi:hypothetical protein AZE42_00946 [Rhizopogon vesiculosus]|uniref:IMD domain-containing protein n=1 Tax=Rhizopogon vesiculosus TaxID=180088 RepID=A0A1J8QPC0_9AGAM|nr:hypothetical protein AZE42_00946 [Rhizopogon vesiculosus]